MRTRSAQALPYSHTLAVPLRQAAQDSDRLPLDWTVACHPGGRGERRELVCIQTLTLSLPYEYVVGYVFVLNEITRNKLAQRFLFR